MIHYASGDLFDAPAEVLVNPVNTVGVMGSGLAADPDIDKRVSST